MLLNTGLRPCFGPVEAPATFSLDFSFTDFAESIGLNQAILDDFSSTGLAVSLPPLTINGAVSNFVANPLAPIDEINLGMTTSFSGGALSAMADVGGAMFITYDYTPRAVPEPGTLALLLAGLVGFGLSRQRDGSFPR